MLFRINKGHRTESEIERDKAGAMHKADKSYPSDVIETIRHTTRLGQHQTPHTDGNDYPKHDETPHSHQLRPR